jgi:hypothetical protein
MFSGKDGWDQEECGEGGCSNCPENREEKQDGSGVGKK